LETFFQVAECILERRLVTILAADAVGYSQKMAQDEGSAYAELSRCRDIIDPLIDSHGGRIFGSAGDSVLAEFTSSVKAVECAIEIQQKLLTTEAVGISNAPLAFRIGVNFGDVIIENANRSCQTNFA
jgi:class 3 adenylate cyclase